MYEEFGLKIPVPRTRVGTSDIFDDFENDISTRKWFMGQRRLECRDCYCRELARTQQGGMSNAHWFQKKPVFPL